MDDKQSDSVTPENCDLSITFYMALIVLKLLYFNINITGFN